ncbi:uncharacterized protein VTP21DRAFT_3988 [Calcarisporiella thermophila]|uniref:uncharacterized protein n=1 Tax=Calcarisporiella thermophila TaxID=911321 RepID=UPI003743CA7D
MATMYRSSRRPPSFHGDSSEATSPNVNDARKRQSKKDEAIRKKIEQELSKKRNSPRQTRLTSKKQIQGTVSALRPSFALTVRENCLVVEASQLMAAKRSDCVLVVDDEDRLCGIFTAKDIAFRLVAEDYDARATPVSVIMTRNPTCVTSDTPAPDALETMVQRGFRHLPVLNEDGDVVGLLDITKCLLQALERMDRAFGTSRKLYEALEGVQSEWSGADRSFFSVMKQIREKMSCPDLNSVLDGAQHAEVGVRTNVHEAAKLMKSVRKTSVLVMENGNIAGIFTSKDIVLRVIAAGLAPSSCSVVRVMTPHPDTATPTTTILDALKKMHEGHYLNLPVIDDISRDVLGVVNVLQLTYAMLEEISSIEGQGEKGRGMVNRFWQSFATHDDAESASVTSDTVASTPSGAGHVYPPTPSSISRASRPNTYPSRDSPTPSQNYLHEEQAAAEGEYTFKFRSPTGKMHRFVAETNSLSHIRDAIKSKLLNERISLEDLAASLHADTSDAALDDSWIALSYVDDDNDHVLISSDADLMDSVQVARRQGAGRVMLYLHDHLTQQPITEPVLGATGGELDHNPTASREDEKREVEKKAKRLTGKREEKPAPFGGIPNELLLPGAIVALAATILCVFVVGRLTRSK